MAWFISGCLLMCYVIDGEREWHRRGKESVEVKNSLPLRSKGTVRLGITQNVEVSR